MPFLSKTRVFLLLLALMLPQLASAAEQADVVFLIGRGYVVDGAAQHALAKGMKLSSDAVIRLENKSFVTLAYKGNNYTIRSVRDVTLSTVLSGAKPDAAVSPLMKIFEKAKSSSRTEVLAVRAEKMPGEGNVVWAEGESSGKDGDDGAECYTRLSGMLAAADYGGVIRYYTENRSRFGARADDAVYAAALSYFYLCRYDESLALMKPLCDGAKDLTLRENAQFYAAFALHSGMCFTESNSCLDRFFRTGSRNPFAPYALYIMGLNDAAIGKTAEAQRCFTRVVENYPSDPIAADAASLITR